MTAPSEGFALQEEPGAGDAPPTGLARWKLVGPGIVVAATGVGAGDLVATLIVGARFGYALLWAAVIGCIVKIALAEATGRYHLATGRSEEHTSELQSLMRISYAVFCLK